jgi:hypothetical protein
MVKFPKQASDNQNDNEVSSAYPYTKKWPEVTRC